MSYMNQVLLVGHLTRNPECRYTAGGHAVAGFSLALNRNYRDAKGEPREEVCFVEVEAFGELAESLRSYLGKGSMVYVEGRLRTSQWRDKRSGRIRHRLKVAAQRIDFLSPPSRSGTFQDEPPDRP